MLSIKELGERGAGAARSAGSTLGRFAGRAAAAGYGRVAELRRRPKLDMDDKTLARKVESTIFRGADAPKGKVNVNVVDGVVELRGEVKRPEEIRALEAATRTIPEVRDVRNLLHQTKTPSPTRTDTPARQRRSAEGRQTKQRKRVEKTAERTREVAEPTPREVAREGSGRKPAPLGSEGEGGSSEPGTSAGTAGSAERAEPQGATPPAGARPSGKKTAGGRGSTGGTTSGAANRAKSTSRR